MADESKLLTETELQAIAERDKAFRRADEHSFGPWIKPMKASQADVRCLLADLRRYRDWCKELIDCSEDTPSLLRGLVKEVRAALTTSQSDTSVPPTAL